MKTCNAIRALGNIGRIAEIAPRESLASPAARADQFRPAALIWIELNWIESAAAWAEWKRANELAENRFQKMIFRIKQNRFECFTRWMENKLNPL